jgi:hypothetical protein
MWRCLLVGSCLLTVVGCGGNPLAGLQSPEQLTLFSIDGRDEDRGVRIQTSESFHGYPVLGKVEVSDLGQRQHLIAALKDGVARNDVPPPSCFWPRHGLRVVENGKTVEYIICFECYQFDEFVGGKKLRHGTISSAVQPTFDAPLKAAGVPIAPK